MLKETMSVAPPSKTRWLKKTVGGPKVGQKRTIARANTAAEEPPSSSMAEDTSTLVPTEELETPRPKTRRTRRLPSDKEDKSSDITAGLKARRKRTLSSSSKSSTESNPPTKQKCSSDRTKQFFDAPDPSTMTMQDLIYYNPSANPMKSSSKAVTKTNSFEKEDADPIPKNEDSDHDGSEEDEGNDGRVVPQLKIGPDGTIQVDEDSIVVEATKKRSSETLTTEVITEASYATSKSFRQTYKIKRWNKVETDLFYKALSQVGTDFTMMTLLIPKRSRKELKNKFKKEEKVNPARISAAFNRLCHET